MTKISRRRTIGAAVALTLGLTPFGVSSGAIATDIGPPLYVASRGAAKVYLFGGANVEDRLWLTPTIEAALDSMVHFWEEDPPGPSKFNRQLNIDLGTRAGGTLWDDLDANQEARVLKVATLLGLSREQLSPMLPWAAGAVVAAVNQPRYMANNKIAEGGGQAILQKFAQNKGVPITGEVDQWDDWVRFYASLPPKAAVQYLLYQCDIVELPADRMRTWSDQWLHGDVAGWLAWNDHLRNDYPDLFAVLETGRNQKWADRIDTMLKDGGVHFIVVGVEHTVGPTSVQELSRRRGIVFSRAE